MLNKYVKPYVLPGHKIWKMVIKPLEFENWEAVKSIYLEGILTGLATFETAAPTWEEWDARHLPFARIVAEGTGDGVLFGWAALSPVSSRKAYAGVAEVSVYVAANARGTGVGRALLEQLIEESERNGVWTLQASIFEENVASMRLHHSLGFRTVGFRERIAKLNGSWRDTMILERRSQVAGME